MTTPAWSRSSGITSYGGHANKANYMGQGLIDSRTDVGADDVNRIAADLRAAVVAAPFLVARLTLHDTSPADPTVHWCAFMPAGQSAVDFEGDSPPTGFPTFERSGTGMVLITFDASYEDEYGNSEATNLYSALGSGAGSVFANVAGSIPSSVTAEFLVTGTGGTAINDQTITVRVY